MISQEVKLGGGGGIRTPGPREGTSVFKTDAIDHSATPPMVCAWRQCYPQRLYDC